VVAGQQDCILAAGVGRSAADAILFKDKAGMEPKLIYLARRNPALTRDAFTARWRRHGALGMSMPRWVNIRRYVHCDVMQAGIPGVDDGYDGIGLIWHRSPEARARHRADNSSQGMMEADEAETFAEPVYNFCLLAREYILKDAGSGPVKLIRFVERADGVSRGEFEDAWRGAYAAALLQAPEVAANIQRYVQNHVLPPEQPPRWGLAADCVDEFWFASMREATTAFDAIRQLARPEADLVSRSIWVATNEVVLHDKPEP